MCSPCGLEGRGGLKWVVWAAIKPETLKRGGRAAAAATFSAVLRVPLDYKDLSIRNGDLM